MGMKTLGKKMKKNAGTLEMYTLCMCATCACGVSGGVLIDSGSAKWNVQKKNIS
jgi:putative bacteriocin precursor